MVNEFCNVIDNTNTPDIPKDISNDDIYKLFNLPIPKTNYFSIRNVITTLWEKVFETIRANKQTCVTNATLLRIRKHLILESFFYETPLNEYYHTVEAIINNYNKSFNFFKPFTDVKSWTDAIKIIKSILMLRGKPSLGDKQLRFCYSSELDLVNSASYWKENGYNITLEFGRFKLNKESTKDICNKIEHEIKQANGLTVIHHLLKGFKKINHLEYYINIPSDNEDLPRIPTSFLINLSLKYIRNTPHNSQFIPSIIEKSRHLIRLCDVQKLPSHFIFPTEIISYLKQIRLHDSVFKFSQFIPKYIITTIKGLFSWIDKKTFEDKLGFTLDEYLSVIDSILHIDKSKIHKFTSSDIQNIKLKTDKVEFILDWAAHTPTDINKGYKLPFDYTELSFHKKALVKLTDTEYCLIDKTLCAENFITSLAMAFLDTNNFYEKLGIQLEKFVKDELNKKRISNTSGKYEKFNSQSGDCDLILESDKNIIFIELKTKELTLKSKSGNDEALTVDIINSLLYEHYQTGKHKTLLNKYGEILFTDGNKIQKNNRSIDRLGIVFSDYGSFQDKEVVTTILTAFLEIDDIDFLPKKNSFQKFIKALRAEQNTSFMDCSFISLSDFLVLVDNADSVETLTQSLLITKNVSYQSSDFLVEYFCASKLKALK